MSQVTLGELLRRHRLGASLTQKELADMIGYHNSVVSRVERGRQLPTSDYLEQFIKNLYLSEHDCREILSLCQQETQTATDLVISSKQIEALVENLQTVLREVGGKTEPDLQLKTVTSGEIHEESRATQMVPQLNGIEHIVDLADQSYGARNFEDALRLYLRAGQRLVRHDWSFTTGLKIRGLDIADINQDGFDEVLVASEDQSVYVLDHSGEELWRYETQGWVLGVQALDIDQDGKIEIIAGSDKIYVFDSEGNLETSFATYSDVSSLCIQANDISEPLKIIAGHDDGDVTAWNIEGQLLWRYHCPKRVICMLADDIDQDGKVEVVAGSEDKNIYILNDQGGLKDVFESNHWILTVAAADIYNEGCSRLLVASFEGDVHAYKYAKAATLKIRQHGILGISLAQMLSGSSGYQIILGSSDRGVSIFDLDGNLLWRFNTSYGHRVLQARANEKSNWAQIVVGAEDGVVHSYRMMIMPGLVEAIRETYSKIDPRRLRRIGLTSSELRLLAAFVHLDPINRDASLANIDMLMGQGNLQEAIELTTELWRNGIEYRWCYETGGRIYALSVARLGLENEKCVLAGSEDGNAYALKASDGSVHWKFSTRGGVRGIHAAHFSNSSEHEEIVIGSVDGNVYLLNYEGNPQWNFQTQDWVLYTHAQCIDNDGIKEILFGSDGHYIGVTQYTGQLVWMHPTLDRVRAVACYDIDGDGYREPVVGSDDKWVYILDRTGEVKHRFEVPHWVLVIHVDDIDNDGDAEILVGTEDGHLYVYSRFGTLKWKYRTGHWIAALDTHIDPFSGEKHVIIGSADRHIYCLSPTGILVWQFETAARVRTLHLADVDEDGCTEVIFGSYDQNIYLFSIFDPQRLRQTIADITVRLTNNAKFSWERLAKDRQESTRAFVCLCTDDRGLLLSCITDDSEWVRAAAVCSLVKNGHFARKTVQNIIASFLLNEASSQVRLLVYRELRASPRVEASIGVLELMVESMEDVSDSRIIVELMQHIRLLANDNSKLIDSVLLKVANIEDSWVSLEADRLG